MIIGRNSELKQLSTYYDRSKSQIVVMYGEPYTGKTALVKEFMEDKPGYYYCAFPASEREQKYRLGLWLASLNIKTLKYPEFSEVFTALGKEHTQKKVIVIDEFQHIIKTCPTFMDELISFIHNSWNNQEYLIILLSSSIGFIENSMVSKIDEAAYELSGFIKLKELSFS
ncbi:MAG: ATP-binding protein, partial [Lachnospiraceae bacterium]|nr:ATP-binding protein [Lachnospiraceae bacterium]